MIRESRFLSVERCQQFQHHKRSSTENVPLRQHNKSVDNRLYLSLSPQGIISRQTFMSRQARIVRSAFAQGVIDKQGKTENNAMDLPQGIAAFP